MLSIGASFLPNTYVKTRTAANVLDFLGGVTAIVLAALALTNHGGSMIAHLNDPTGGAWALMAGGVTAIGTVALNRFTAPASDSWDSGLTRPVFADQLMDSD